MLLLNLLSNYIHVDYKKLKCIVWTMRLVRYLNTKENLIFAIVFRFFNILSLTYENHLRFHNIIRDYIIPDVNPNPNKYPRRRLVFFPLSGVASSMSMRPAPIMAERKPARKLVKISTYTPAEADAHVIMSVPYTFFKC